MNCARNITSILGRIFEKHSSDETVTYVMIFEERLLYYYFFQIFNVQTLDLKSVGMSFGFVSPPHIDLGVGVSKKMAREGKKHKDQKKSKIYRQGKPKGFVQFAR